MFFIIFSIVVWVYFKFFRGCMKKYNKVFTFLLVHYNQLLMITGLVIGLLGDGPPFRG